MHLNLNTVGFVAGCAGYVLLVAGVASFDWRAGLVVGGMLLLGWSALVARALARAPAASAQE